MDDREAAKKAESGEGAEVAEPLQFDREEPAAGAEAPADPAVCEVCTKLLENSYYEVDGHPVCVACHEKNLAHPSSWGGLRVFGRALAYGVGAAAVGAAIYFAVLTLTGYELGLIAVVVGFLVGRAVNLGSGGRGGYRYQALAMALTYSAIATTYMPIIYRTLRDTPAEATSASAPSASVLPGDAPAPSAAPTPATPAQPTPASAEPPGLIGALASLFLAVFVLFLFAAASPILAGPANFMGWIIIGIALYEAWKLNKRTIPTVTGPHDVATATAAV